MRKLLLAVAVVLFPCAVVSAQSPMVGTGAYPFASLDNRGFDSINIGNLNTRFNVPIVSKAGRGLPFNYSIQYEGLVWQPYKNGTTTTWVPSTNFGFTGTLNGVGIIGTLSYTYAEPSCGTELVGSRRVSDGYIYTSNYAYHDPFGAVHPLNYSSSSECDKLDGTMVQPASTTGNGAAKDGSGYTLINSGTQVRSRDGAIVQPTTSVNGASPSGSAFQADSNGNQISFDGSSTYTDTTGASELIISGSNPVKLTYPVAKQSNGASSASASLYYKQYTVRTNFGCSGIVEYGSNLVNLVDHITLADGSTYSFTYESTPGATDSAVTARIASVTLPTGGKIGYSRRGGCGAGSGTGILPDGSSGPLTRTTTDGLRTYDRVNVSGSSSSTVLYDEKGNQTLYHFSVDANGNYEATHQQVYQGAASGTPLEEIITCYNGSSGSCDGQAITPPITKADTTTSYNGGSQSLVKNTYDTSGNLLSSATYSGTTLLTQTTNTYNANSEVLSTKMTDGSSNTIALSTYGYDEYTSPHPPLTATSGLPQHGAASSIRGNQTSSYVSIDGTTSNMLTTTTAYYDTGMPVSTTAQGSFTTTYGYDSTQTFTTSTTLPKPSSGATLTTSATYDSASGALLTGTGMNAGQTITATQYDPLLRLTAVTTPENGQTTTTYTPNQISAKTMMSSSQSNDKESYLDAYGRVNRVAIASSSGWYLTDSCYDAAGLLQYQSTPYVSSSQNPSSYNCSASTATQYTYDALGRQTQVAQPDGSSVAYTYLSRAVKSATSNGVVRVTQYDLLGRIIEACEISTVTNMPGSGGPGSCGTDMGVNGYGTSYAYNLAGHSVTVTQGVQQHRTFTTDAIGRTTQTIEPESGTTNYSYAYNGTGLVMTRTRPRTNQTNSATLTTTTTQYDALGRVLSIGYTDGTAGSNFGYDLFNGSPLGKSLGQMTSASNNNESGFNQRTYSYDIMGRVSNTNDVYGGQTNNNMTRLFGYDLASNMKTEQYSTVLGGGSPATLSYTYNTAGQLTYVNGTQGSGSNGTNSYSTNPNTMTPFGPALVEWGNSLFTTYTYNAAGRLSGASTCAGAQGIGCPGGQTIYAYTATTQGDQVKQSTDSVTGQQLSYGYDDFARLKTVAKTGGSGPALGMNFVYDWWGNRWGQNITSGSGPQPQLTYDQTKNQITTTGYAYDAAGNVINDGIHSYAYDGENRLRLIDGGSTAQYQYGPFGERLLAAWGGQYQRYTTDLQNRRSITLVNGSLAANGVQFYAGAQKHAYWSSSDNNFHFEHTDWLGTVRVRTNSVGAVEGSYGSLPFGDGLTQSGSDNNLNHFTGLDADVGNNAGLEHATYRELGTTAGRWTSPDPDGESYDASNPQSMNRYSYVLNNPLFYIDPDGTSENGPCPPGQYCVYTNPPPPVPTQPSLPAGTVPPGTGPSGGPGNTGGNGDSGGGSSGSGSGNAPTSNTPTPHTPVKITLCGVVGSCIQVPLPSCAFLHTLGNALKGVGAVGAVYKGIGATIVATGGTDLPEAGVALGVAAISGGSGTLAGIAAEYQVGCTP